MFQYVALSDGTTTLELTDDINYALVSYAPIVAPLRDGLLGDGVYADATESLTFHAIGCTAAEAYAAAAAINALLDQARRWWLGQGVTAVRLFVKAQGSALVTLSVQIKGRAPGGPSNVALPATFHEYYGKYLIQSIVLQVVRRGQFLGADDSAGPSGAATNPNVEQVTFSSSHPTSSPLDLVIAGFNFVTTPLIKAGYLIVGSQANDVQVRPVTGATAANWTAFADAAHLGFNASVLRYTPVATTASTSGDIALSFVQGNMALIAKVRNNSATTVFTVTASFRNAYGTVVSLPSVTIDASSLNPRMVFLGSATVPPNTNIITLTVQASAASGTIDFDALLVANLRDESCAVIAHDDIALGALNGNLTLQFLSMRTSTTYLMPQVQLVDVNAHIAPVTYRGVLPLATVGADVFAVWTATNGIYWSFTDSTNAKVNVTLQATRHRAYLVPQ
jgi:hypothetical protein